MSAPVKVKSDSHFWKDGFEPLEIEVTVDRIRNLGRLHRGRSFSTEEAKALLLLYRSQLEDVINTTIQNFVKGKL